MPVSSATSKKKKPDPRSADAESSQDPSCSRRAGESSFRGRMCRESRLARPIRAPIRGPASRWRRQTPPLLRGDLFSGFASSCLARILACLPAAYSVSGESSFRGRMCRESRSGGQESICSVAAGASSCFASQARRELTSPQAAGLTAQAKRQYNNTVDLPKRREKLQAQKTSSSAQVSASSQTKPSSLK